MSDVQSEATRRLNTLWASWLIDALAAAGCTRFFLSPGSRSTPLVVAAARQSRAQITVCYDERGGGFAAVGWGRATGAPAVLICTSGTAAANYLPAVIEADRDAVPVVLLTADRPPELQEAGANQTIDQVRLFGRHLRWQWLAPAPASEIQQSVAASAAAHAVATAAGATPGPVQLNCPFREPLEPPDEPPAPPPATAGLTVSPARYLSASRLAPEAAAAVAAELAGEPPGLVVVGRLRPDGPGVAHAGQVVGSLARRLGWPLMTDITSGLRGERQGVRHYDLLLGSPAVRGALRPRTVLHLGGRLTSKRLASFLAEASPAAYVHCADHHLRIDPGKLVTLRVQADPLHLCVELTARITGDRASPPALARADSAAGEAVDQVLTASGLSEAWVTRELTRHLPDSTGLVLAASLPVRHADAYADPPALGNLAAPLVAANRGASGIDGTVATAVGFQLGVGRSVALLIGDLALLHDASSLSLLRPQTPLLIVALNNGGGGIFSFLPIAKQKQLFEPYFATPHQRSFAGVANSFDLEYSAPTTQAGFREALQAWLQKPRATLIEVSTERSETHRLAIATLQAVSAAAEPWFSG